MQDVNFCVAYRIVWRQNSERLGNPMRLLLLDPMTDWALTPQEKRVKANQEVIRNWLRSKYEQHNEWRLKNPM